MRKRSAFRIPQQSVKCNLESELAAELPHARAVGDVGPDDHARRGRIDGAIGVAVIDVIQHVVRICSELELQPLSDREGLPDAEVHIEETWSVETVTEILTERAGCWESIRSRIEPLPRSVMASSGVWIANPDGVERAAPACIQARVNSVPARA